MTTLYFSPGACSFAAHVLLEELGAPYDTVRVSVAPQDQEQRKPEYLAVNPRARVPALAIADEILTESPAILAHLADNQPQAQLLPPPGSLPRARADEWMSFLSSTVHIAFAHLFRPERYADEATAKDEMKRKARSTIEHVLADIEGHLPAEGFALGRYSAIDPYLFVFYRWSKLNGFDTALTPKYRALAGRVLERPAVQRVFEQEKLPAFAV